MRIGCGARHTLIVGAWALVLATTTAQVPPAAERIEPLHGDNYYAASNRVEVNTPKAGDVVVAGRVVEISQPVAGDVLAAGWRVNLSGSADDDVRMAAAEVTLNAPVRGDVTVAGGDVNFGSEARVSGRSWITGNLVRLDGIYEREVRVAGATVQIGGAATYAIALFAAVLATAFCVGEAEAKFFNRPVTSRGQHAMMLLAGVLTLAVLRSVLGGLIVLGSVLFGLGALALVAYDNYSREAPAAA